MLTKLYLIALPIFCILDVTWVGLIAHKFYISQIGSMMKANPNWYAIILFYLLYIGALIFFVINPAIEKQSWTYALTAGGFFGLIAYGTYDLTSLGLIKDFPVSIAVVDMIWGAVISGVTSALAFLLYTKFF